MVNQPSSGDQNFPDEWISIAAYYIWKNDGQPNGRDAEYWERAKAELLQLQKDGNLPTAPQPQTLDEER
jgi:Protein of unknown function (DUF2934)